MVCEDFSPYTCVPHSISYTFFLIQLYFKVLIKIFWVYILQLWNSIIFPEILFTAESSSILWSRFFLLKLLSLRLKIVSTCLHETSSNSSHTSNNFFSYLQQMLNMIIRWTVRFYFFCFGAHNPPAPDEAVTFLDLLYSDCLGTSFCFILESILSLFPYWISFYLGLLLSVDLYPHLAVTWISIALHKRHFVYNFFRPYISVYSALTVSWLSRYWILVENLFLTEIWSHYSLVFWLLMLLLNIPRLSLFNIVCRWFISILSGSHEVFLFISVVLKFHDYIL